MALLTDTLAALIALAIVAAVFGLALAFMVSIHRLGDWLGRRTGPYPHENVDERDG